MNTIKPWKHLLIELEESLTSIGREIGVTPQGVRAALFNNRSKRIQFYVLQKAKQKGIPIPKELSTIM